MRKRKRGVPLGGAVSSTATLSLPPGAGTVVMVADPVQGAVPSFVAMADASVRSGVVEDQMV